MGELKILFACPWGFVLGDETWPGPVNHAIYIVNRLNQLCLKSDWRLESDKMTSVRGTRRCWASLPADALAYIINECGLCQSDVAYIRLVCVHWRATTNSHLKSLAPACTSLEQVAGIAQRFPFLTTSDLTRCDTRYGGNNVATMGAYRRCIFVRARPTGNVTVTVCLPPVYVPYYQSLPDVCRNYIFILLQHVCPRL